MTCAVCSVQRDGVHFRRPLTSLSLLASSSLRKSFVFWARSLRWVRVSRWWATRSEATVSSCGTRVVRSISTGAVSAVAVGSCRRGHHVLRHAPMAFWNLLSATVPSCERVLSVSEMLSMAAARGCDGSSCSGREQRVQWAAAACAAMSVTGRAAGLDGGALAWARRLRTAFTMHRHAW